MATGFMAGRRGRGKAGSYAIALSLPCLWLGATAQALEIQVIGLFSGKAIVAVDGARPRTYNVGDVLAGGRAKLVAATSEAAVFEIEGKRQTLTMGQQAISNSYKASGRPTVVLNADTRGHYLTDGSVNGVPIQFMVDTGATLVSLGLSDARRIGVNYLAGQRGFSNTANGPAPVYKVKLNSVKVGTITLTNVDGLVHETTDMPFALLGMSFLSRLEMKNEGSRLTLTQRF